MKKQIIIFSFISVAILAGCAGKVNKEAGSGNEQEVSQVPDTGFTGIKKYTNKEFVSYEATFKNGVQHGLMTTYYPSGKIYRTFWYENGIRQDTSVWYHEDGKIFRKTPYKNDSIHGIQIQYYKSGKVRARLEFDMGLRKPFLEEWTSDGKKIVSYPELVIKTTDKYSSDGTFIISLELSKKDNKATFYRGEYIDGLFVPKKYTRLNNSETTGALVLKKTGTPGNNYVGIIAEINTTLGNKHLVYKRVDLPYNDLK